MSQPYDGRSASGSVRRARERAQAAMPTDRGNGRQYQPQMMGQDSPQGGLSPPPSRPSQAPYSAPPRAYKPRVAPAIEGNIGQSISRPKRIPQWPLPGSPGSPMTPTDNNEPYRPPPNRPQQAPQRPPRPSLVPSIVDQSRLQEHTPMFFAREGLEEEDDYAQAPPSSRLTTSSVGSIPDFPEPAAASSSSNVGPVPRRGSNLGPPPSSRRGASSFYSHTSYVSPIPEESLRSRSHMSDASSGVMPNSQYQGTPLGSPGHGDAFYDDSVTDRSRESLYDEFGDESKLVRSASVGKKGKPSLVVTRAPGSADRSASSLGNASAPKSSPFAGGTGLRMGDSSSSGTSSAQQTPEATPGTTGKPVTPEAMLGAVAAASSPDPSGLRNLTPSPKPPTRLSGLKRPPKLDIDAVREMEARGSITSLPELIRRATRLAAMMERGKRPGSRFDNLGDFPDELDRSQSGEKEGMNEKHQSGLSDMLAAFPPPAQEGRQTRGSWFRTTSWPLVPGRPGAQPHDRDHEKSGDSPEPKSKKGRRCCGMPMWLFVLVMILLLCAIAAAVVIPLQFFVFKTLGNQARAQSSLDQCRADLECQNGGTNVLSQGSCSCICTSGFVGKQCEIGGTRGCTTTNLVSSNGETTVQNVTLGRFVPRVIAQSDDNFTVPLSGTAILAKFSAANFSCIAQNSLITFNGRSSRANATTDDEEVQTIETVQDDVSIGLALEAEAEPFVSIEALTEPLPTITAAPTLLQGAAVALATDEADTDTELLVDTSAPPTMSQTSTASRATATSSVDETKNDDDSFEVTEEVLDFARVVVLFLLQEETPASAEAAQGEMQTFFDEAAVTGNSGVSIKEASNQTIGDTATVNFVDFTIDLGDRQVGRESTDGAGSTKRSALPVPLTDGPLRTISMRRRGSILS